MSVTRTPGRINNLFRFTMITGNPKVRTSSQRPGLIARKLIEKRAMARQSARVRVQALEEIAGRPLTNKRLIIRSEQRYMLFLLGFDSLKQRPRGKRSDAIYDAITCAMYAVLFAMPVSRVLRGLDFTVYVASMAALAPATYLFARSNSKTVFNRIDISPRRRSRRSWQIFYSAYMLWFYCWLLYAAPEGTASVTLASQSSIWIVLMLGALGICATISCLTLLEVLLPRRDDRIHRMLSRRIPVEAAVHHLSSSILVLSSPLRDPLPLGSQRQIIRHLDFSAFAIEQGLKGQLDLFDRAFGNCLALTLHRIANNIRDLRLWVAMPRIDTYHHFIERLVASIEFAAAGRWDELKCCEHLSDGRPRTADALYLTGIIILAGTASAAMAFLIGQSMKLADAQITSIFVTIFPLLAGSLSRFLPGLGASKA